MNIYLACPYSHPLPAVREARYQAVNRRAGAIMKGTPDLCIFSPISHSHAIALAGAGSDFSSWMKLDLHMIVEWCDEVWVLALEGWQDSQGVKAEIMTAKVVGKPVRILKEE